MSDLSGHNPVGRFGGLASLYASHRPTYPASAIDFIVDVCRLGPDTLLVDVGCGTGIASRLMAAKGIPVLGIEPNDEMRDQAEHAAPPTTGIAPRYVKGQAEATGLETRSAAAILSAQAFHWFNAPVALAEFHRILVADGYVALIWNERDEADPFTAAYGAVVRSSPEAARVEGPRGQAGQALLLSPLFMEARRVEFTNEQVMDEDGLIGRAFSVSYAPREPVAAAAFADALRRVFREYQKDGRAVMRYVTSVYLARRGPTGGRIDQPAD